MPVQEQEESQQSLELNQQSLESLRESGILLEGEHLALEVDRKVEAGQELSPVEAGVLWLALTNEQVRFVREHGLEA
jgi:hypothetical protein